MIFPTEVENMIQSIEEAGQKVSSDTHAIYAGKETTFFKDLYPLEIIVVDTMPVGTACIITRKEKGNNE